MISTNTKEFLIRARNLIAKPESWTKGYLSRDAQGLVPFTENDAVCWCAVGALQHTYIRHNDLGDSISEALDALDHQIRVQIRVRGGSDAGDLISTSISIFNDLATTTHQDVLDLFDGAISRMSSMSDVT